VAVTAVFVFLTGFICVCTHHYISPTGYSVTAPAKSTGISFGCILTRRFLAFRVTPRASAGSLTLGFDYFKQAPFMGREQPAHSVRAAVKLT